jgi:hypothetical protein
MFRSSTTIPAHNVPTHQIQVCAGSYPLRLLLWSTLSKIDGIMIVNNVNSNPGEVDHDYGDSLNVAMLSMTRENTYFGNSEHDTCRHDWSNDEH